MNCELKMELRVWGFELEEDDVINWTGTEAKDREAEKVKGKARVWGELIMVVL
jgi:hypothetical protein